MVTKLFRFYFVRGAFVEFEISFASLVVATTQIALTQNTKRQYSRIFLLYQK